MARERWNSFVISDAAPPELDAELEADLTAKHQRAAMVAYQKGQLAQALQEWERQPQPAILRAERLLVAEALAAAGDARVLEMLETGFGTPEGAVEREALLARYAVKTEAFAEAAQHLEAALIGYRTMPWAFEPLMNRTLRVAVDVAKRDKDLGLRLFGILKQPFAVFALNHVRESMALELSEYLGFTTTCVEALAAAEPHVPWEEVFLRRRMECYRDTDHALTEQAMRDYDAYMMDEPLPFGLGLDVRAL